MKTLATLTAVVALAMFGLTGPSAAFDDGNDASPGQVDILTLTATSDGASKTITVTMALESDTDLDGASYRVHFDHKAPFASEGNELCETTSDDTVKTKRRRGLFRDTGPGTVTGQGMSTLVFRVDYADLLVASGDPVEIWADTHLSGNTMYKGIRDRAPDTDPSDGCSKPQAADEVLQITLN